LIDDFGFAIARFHQQNGQAIANLKSKIANARLRRHHHLQRRGKHSRGV
jgi:hypothetical protein